MDRALKRNNIKCVSVYLDHDYLMNWDDRVACEHYVMGELGSVVKKWTRAEVDAIAAKHCARFDSVQAVYIGLESD